MFDSPIGWVGGKFRLRSKIIPLIPEHKCYVEVFGGAGWVLFGKEPSKCEIYNDIDGELVNMFRVLRDRRGEFIQAFSYGLNSRQEFEDLKKLNPSTLSEVERARRMLYLVRNSFGAYGPSKATFVTAKSRSMGVHLHKLVDIVEKVSWRLAPVGIENLDFEKLIDVYDGDQTFFYIDPPYYGADCYQFNFSEAEFTRLRQRLDRVAGKFLLSINDHPHMRELFDGFVIQEVEVPYSLGSADRKNRYGELLIGNYGFEVTKAKGKDMDSRLRGNDVM